jgi:hypothetical protein
MLKPQDQFYKVYKNYDITRYDCKECCNIRYKKYVEKVKSSPAKITRTSKICQICKNEKPISQFGKANAKPDKHLSYCKPCWLVYVNKAKEKLSKKK